MSKLKHYCGPPRQRDVSRALCGGHHGGGGGAEGEVVDVSGVRVAAAVVARHGPGVVLVGERACNSEGHQYTVQ